MKNVLVLINPRSGLLNSFRVIRAAFAKYWERDHQTMVFYQFTRSKQDGERKAKVAVDKEFDTLIVAGGDGTVSTIGRILIGSNTVLGVIPTGSGNGFARHFGIPIDAAEAIKALATANPTGIDVGQMNDIPFFVTCSMAWDAAIVRSFERYPFRGILPYILAGVQEMFDYTPTDIEVMIDGNASRIYEEPVVFTIANMTQFGGGAKIAPTANPHDGKLELVVGLKKHTARLLASLPRLFDGTINQITSLHTQPFSTLKIIRKHEGFIQIDGELIEAPKAITIQVKPQALQVLIPQA